MAATTDPKLLAAFNHLTKVLKLSAEATKNLTKKATSAGGPMKSMAQGLAGGVIKSLVDILFSFPPQLKKIETLGAKFSKSFEESFTHSQELSESIRGGVDVYDAFIFGLATSRRGLDSNNAALQDLAAITHATGENVTELIAGMMQVSIGLGNNQANVLSLNKTMEKTSRAFNRSREELVKAMGKLTQSTLNLLAMGGAQGTQFQEGLMLLKSFVPDEQLFGQVTNSIQKLLSPAGLTRSLILGLDTSKYLTGQAKVGDLLTDTLKLEKEGLRISRMVAAGGPAVQASLGALQSVFGDVGDFIRAGNTIRQMAEDMNIQVQGRSTKQIVTAITKFMEKRSKENKAWHKTITTIQDEIFRPLKNGMAEVGLKLKDLLEASGDTLQSIAKAITSGLLLVIGAILQALTWFVEGEMDKELRTASKSIMGLRTAFDADSAASKAQRATIAKNTDPGKKRDLADAFKRGNLFAVRQTDALLGDIYRVMVKDNRLLQALLKKEGAAVVLPVGGGSSVRLGGGL